MLARRRAVAVGRALCGSSLPGAAPADSALRAAGSRTRRPPASGARASPAIVGGRNSVLSSQQRPAWVQSQQLYEFSAMHQRWPLAYIPLDLQELRAACC
eukprot:scaffold316_cov351-Prasinococcus_capsulatus_cf.AAC.5